jgi:hypothetical protein
MKRTSPLMYHEEEDTFAVMASKGGQADSSRLVSQCHRLSEHLNSDWL